MSTLFQPWHLSTRGSRILPRPTYSPTATKAAREAAIKKSRQDTLRKDIEGKLEDYSLEDLKAWEDQEGFDEIVTEMNQLQQATAHLGMQGINLQMPTTPSELALVKKLDDKFMALQGKSDRYMEAKKQLNELEKIVLADMKKAPEEQTIDYDNYFELKKKYIDTEGLDERVKLIPQMLKTKDKPTDLMQYVKDYFPTYVPGEDKELLKIVDDPDVGKVLRYTKTFKDPQRVKEGMTKMYNALPEADRKRLEAEAKADVYSKSGLDHWLRNYTPESGEKKEVTSLGAPGQKFVPFTTPPKDEKGDYVLTAESRYYTAPYGTIKDEKGKSVKMEFESLHSVGLQDVFRKTTDAFQEQVSADTNDTETGKPEVGVGGSYWTLPQKINLLPVADQDITLTRYVGGTVPYQTRIIKKDDILTKADVEEINRQNRVGAGIGIPSMKTLTYTYHYDLYVDENISYRQVPTEDDVQSFNVSVWRPLDEVSDDYDTATKKDRELNESLNERIRVMREIREQVNNKINQLRGTTKKKPEPYF